MDVSSFVPIRLGIERLEGDHDEEGDQVKGRVLPCVVVEAYSVGEEGTLSDREVVDLPTAVLEGAELEHVGGQEVDLLLVAPCDEDVVVVPQGDPWGLEEVDALGPLVGEDLGHHACVGDQVGDQHGNVGDRGERDGEGEGDPSDWDLEGVEWGEELDGETVPVTLMAG